MAGQLAFLLENHMKQKEKGFQGIFVNTVLPLPIRDSGGKDFTQEFT